MGSVLGWTLVDKKGELVKITIRERILFNAKRESLRYLKAPGEKIVRARLTWISEKVSKED